MHVTTCMQQKIHIITKSNKKVVIFSCMHISKSIKNIKLNKVNCILFQFPLSKQT
ncbi:hypothetical protein Fmac_022442 [Flemingia macrophylla]|uniref:Uncharacterized protein n=1 Tax=Flemingia macrophylla TaxID=520843 RepID=A0ABD1M1H6_9FABA